MGKRIFIAGHQGMVGSALYRRLSKEKDIEIITATRHDLDLMNQAAVYDFFQKEMVDQVYMAAAKVGGIYANKTYPANFIHQNLVIQSNVIEGAFRSGVSNLLFLGSSCIYPRLAEQPMREDALLSGTLEPTNEPYAIAKIAGIKLCESYNRQYDVDYRSVMPTNLYGPNDNFHPDNSHVIPALLRRFHEAAQSSEPEVIVWGSGNPRREFLHVDDMADACVHIMNLHHSVYQENNIDPMVSHINVGTGADCTIRELATIISQITGFRGKLTFDSSKPDGAPRKLMDVSRLAALGWKASIGLKEGLEQAYAWYLRHLEDARGH